MASWLSLLRAELRAGEGVFRAGPAAAQPAGLDSVTPALLSLAVTAERPGLAGCCPTTFCTVFFCSWPACSCCFPLNWTVCFTCCSGGLLTVGAPPEVFNPTAVTLA